MALLQSLQRLWPHGDQHIPGLIEGIAATAPAVFKKYGITTPLTIAIMMAQFSEECAAGLDMEENMNYSAQRLLQVFPRHFTPTLAAKAAHNGRMIADIAYGGRMGNAPPPSDDGWNYRGRGLSQVTGKGNPTISVGGKLIQEASGYTAVAEKTGLDVLGSPALLSDPQHALECGVADFVICGCLPFAVKGDVINVTKHLNGGLNGLGERQRWTGLWRTELGV